jgi:hypothetical protein
MRKNTILSLLAVGLVVCTTLLIFTGCPQDESESNSIDVETRARRFIRDLNNDRSSLYKNLHPDVSWRDEAKNTANWAADFPDGTYGYSSLDISSSQAVINLNEKPGTFVEDTITLKMKKDDGDQYVWEVYTGAVLFEP